MIQEQASREVLGHKIIKLGGILVMALGCDAEEVGGAKLSFTPLNPRVALLSDLEAMRNDEGH